MERITNMLLAILLIVAAVIAITFIFYWYIGIAVYIWFIVVITVFTALIYEAYDVSLEENLTKKPKNQKS